MSGHNAGQWSPQASAPADARGLGWGPPQPGRVVTQRQLAQMDQKLGVHPQTSNIAVNIVKTSAHPPTIVQKETAHQPPSAIQTNRAYPASKVNGSFMVDKFGKQVVVAGQSIPIVPVALGLLFALWRRGK